MSYEKKKALYAGTFDVFTNGHYDIVGRALRIFDELTILVAVSPTKHTLLPKELRVSMLKELFKNEPRIKVDSWDGLTIEYAERNGVTSIVRGLRATGDFETEYQMASMNRQLNQKKDTVFLMADANNYYISSSLVKEIYRHGGDISKFVPEVILNELKKYSGKK